MVWGHNHSHRNPRHSAIDFRNVTKKLFRVSFTHPLYHAQSFMSCSLPAVLTAQGPLHEEKYLLGNGLDPLLLNQE